MNRGSKFHKENDNVLFIYKNSMCLLCYSTRSTCTHTFYHFSFQICNELTYSSELKFIYSPNLSFASLHLSKVKPTCIVSLGIGCGCYWNIFYFTITYRTSTRYQFLYRCIPSHVFVLRFLQLLFLFRTTWSSLSCFTSKFPFKSQLWNL